MRIPPKTIASTSGTTTIATTFHRTGQLPSDHVGGRADRAELIPAVTKYMSALDSALLAASQGGDVEGVKKNYQARRDELASPLADTDVASDVRTGVDALLRDGQPC